MSPERHVKVFKNGRNQAVRIPREFELSGEGFLPTAALLSTLGGAGIDMDSEKLGRLLRKHAPTVKAARSDEASGRLRGWERSAIEQAAAGLMDPVGTRPQAG